MMMLTILNLESPYFPKFCLEQGGGGGARTLFEVGRSTYFVLALWTGPEERGQRRKLQTYYILFPADTYMFSNYINS